MEIMVVFVIVIGKVKRASIVESMEPNWTTAVRLIDRETQ